MDPFRARAMVEALSTGVHPITGQALSHNDSCSSDEVRQALQEVLQHCTIESAEQYILRVEEDRQAARKHRATENARRYPRGGAPWTAGEEKQLLTMLRRGKNIYQIASSLKRTPRAISERMKNLRYAPEPTDK